MNVVQIFVNQRKPSKQQATINKGRTTEKGRERERERSTTRARQHYTNPKQTKLQTQQLKASILMQTNKYIADNNNNKLLFSI